MIPIYQNTQTQLYVRRMINVTTTQSYHVIRKAPLENNTVKPKAVFYTWNASMVAIMHQINQFRCKITLQGIQHGSASVAHTGCSSRKRE